MENCILNYSVMRMMMVMVMGEDGDDVDINRR